LDSERDQPDTALAHIEEIVTTHWFTARLPDGAVTVTANALGRIRSIELSDAGRTLRPDEITSAIRRLHEEALLAARHAAETAIAEARVPLTARTPVVTSYSGPPRVRLFDR
jgi:glucose/arabinose dehydrogenase